MKVVYCTGYGNPEVLELREVPLPEIKEEEIRVKVKCSNVNSGDVRIRKADPWAVRLFFGWSKPKKNVLGGTFSGVVESVGAKVTQWKPGDEVFGTTDLDFGTYAEYLKVHHNGFVEHKQPQVSFESASSVVFGATTAYDFIRRLKLQSGQRVLIYGASGAVGSAAVQLAKHFGAHVTAVCGSGNRDAVKSLGADEVICYQNTDWPNYFGKYDVVYETVNKLPYSICKKLLKPHGTLILGAADFGTMLRGSCYGLFSNKKVMSGMIKIRKESMALIALLLNDKKLTPLIDRSFSLEEIREAHRYVEAGHKRGNVVLEMEG